MYTTANCQCFSMNGNIFSFHRNWELVLGWIGTFHLKCINRLQCTKFFLVKFSGWEYPKKGSSLWYALRMKWSCREDTLQFLTVVLWFSIRLEVYQYLFFTLWTKWQWKHFKISFSNTVFQKILFYFKSKTLIWSQNIFWRVL